MIERDQFYQALEHLRDVYTSFRNFEHGIGVEMGESEVGNMLESSIYAFCTLILGKDYYDEAIWDMLEGDSMHFHFEPEEGFNEDYSNGTHYDLPYDQYYEYFVERKLDFE